MKHAQFLRFATVGAATFVLTTVLFFVLKTTILVDKPVTAFSLATLVATIVSYVLNREWSFAEQGGRTAAHEAALFFLFSAVSLGLSQIPLAVSRYVFKLYEPYSSLLTEHVADFVSGSIIGTLVGMVFRWWTFNRWVFPEITAPVEETTVDADHGVPQKRPVL